MFDPEITARSIRNKIHGRSWSTIKEKLHGKTIQIHLGNYALQFRTRTLQIRTFQSRTTCHTFHLPSHFTRASKARGLHELTHPGLRCVPITYRILPPFVYEGPAVAVLFREFLIILLSSE